MGADQYENCPKCKGINTVHLYGIHDFELHENGKMSSDAHGQCKECGQNYRMFIDVSEE